MYNHLFALINSLSLFKDEQAPGILNWSNLILQPTLRLFLLKEHWKHQTKKGKNGENNIHK